MTHGNEISFTQKRLLGANDSYKYDSQVSMAYGQRLFKTCFDSKRIVSESFINNTHLHDTTPFANARDSSFDKFIMNNIRPTRFVKFSNTFLPKLNNTLDLCERAFLVDTIARRNKINQQQAIDLLIQHRISFDKNILKLTEKLNQQIKHIKIIKKHISYLDFNRIKHKFSINIFNDKNREFSFRNNILTEIRYTEINKFVKLDNQKYFSKIKVIKEKTYNKLYKRFNLYIQKLILFNHFEPIDIPNNITSEKFNN